MTRLIDADEFRKKLDNCYPFNEEEQSKHGVADIAKSGVLLALAKTPIVDVAPVRRGKWLLEEEITDGLVNWNRWSCSCCGYVRTKGWAATPEGHKPNALICENCGARMVKE